MVEDPPLCCAFVQKKVNVGVSRQCTRYGFVKIEGKWYCSQHDPRRDRTVKPRPPMRLMVVAMTLKRLAREEEGLLAKIIAADKEEAGLYLEPGSVMQLRNLLLELGVEHQSAFDALSSYGHQKRSTPDS
jgi:hypothetical protein